MSAKKAAKKTATTTGGAKKVAKKPDMKPVETNPKKNHPDMKDVIQLATQLVSAQIAAHSHHETTLSLYSEIRKMAMDVMHTPRQNLSPSTNPSSNLFQTWSTPRKPLALQPMSHPDLDRLFQSAMHRAFVMLNAPFDMERIVFAEQIFNPDESLTEGAIRKRFIDFKWPNLKSADSVIKLMKDVNCWFAKHLNDLQASRQSLEGNETVSALDSTIPIETRIDAEAKKLSWLLDQIIRSDHPAPEVLSSYQTLESALRQFINIRNGSDLGGAFRSLDAIERNNLIHVMFGNHVPQDTESLNGDDGEEGALDDEDSEDSTPRPRYRPWAIFRYLRRYGRGAEDELGLTLYKRIRAKRSEITPDRVPDIPGIEPTEFRFGPLHEDVEDLLDFLESEDAFSDCVPDSNAIQLHGYDPEDVAAGASELNYSDFKSGDDSFKF